MAFIQGLLEATSGLDTGWKEASTQGSNISPSKAGSLGQGVRRAGGVS